jgi:phage gp36-like protein
MAYCFVNTADGSPSFEETLGTQLTAQLSGDGEGANIDDAVLDKAITDAQSIVDGKVGVKYAVPFATGSVPRVIAECTLDIAIYKAYENKSGADSRVRRRYEDAMKILDQIATGRFNLNLASGDTVSASAAPTDRVKGKPRLFQRYDE